VGCSCGGEGTVVVFQASAGGARAKADLTFSKGRGLECQITAPDLITTKMRHFVEQTRLQEAFSSFLQEEMRALEERFYATKTPVVSLGLEDDE
jgi:predicted alpha/beta hydrolase